MHLNIKTSFISLIQRLRQETDYVQWKLDVCIAINDNNNNKRAQYTSEYYVFTYS